MISSRNHLAAVNSQAAQRLASDVGLKQSGSAVASTLSAGAGARPQSVIRVDLASDARLRPYAGVGITPICCIISMLSVSIQ